MSGVGGWIIFSVVQPPRYSSVPWEGHGLWIPHHLAGTGNHRAVYWTPINWRVWI